MPGKFYYYVLIIKCNIYVNGIGMEKYYIRENNKDNLNKKFKSSDH